MENLRKERESERVSPVILLRKLESRVNDRMWDAFVYDLPDNIQRKVLDYLPKTWLIYCREALEHRVANGLPKRAGLDLSNY